MTPEQARKVQQAAAVCAAVLSDDSAALAALAGLPPSAFQFLEAAVVAAYLGTVGSEILACPSADPLLRALWALDHLAARTLPTALQWAQSFALAGARGDPP